MSNLDRQLKETLARREPSPEFTARVLASVARTEPERAPWWAGALRWSGALAALAILTVGGWRYQQYREAELAKEQLMLALEITAEKLAMIDQKLGR